MDYLVYTREHGGGTFCDRGVLEPGPAANPVNTYVVGLMRGSAFRIHPLFSAAVNPAVEAIIGSDSFFYAGTWIDPETDLIHVDPVAVYVGDDQETLDAALYMAKLADQKAIFNLRTGETIYVNRQINPDHDEPLGNADGSTIEVEDNPTLDEHWTDLGGEG